MSVFLTFLHKEWYEIKQNRRLLLMLFISLLLPFLINLLTYNPLLPIAIVAPFYIVLSVCVVSEFIKASLIEEIAMSTLDNILIAPFKKDFFIVYKTIIPIVISFIVTVLGMIMNDVASMIVPEFSDFIIMTSFTNILIALIACVTCAWMSFYLLMRTRNTSANFFTMILGTIMVTIGFLAIISNLYHTAIIVVFAFIILPILFIACRVMLTSPQPLKKTIARQWICLFRGQNLNFITAIIVKDLVSIRLLHILEMLLYIILILATSDTLIFYILLFLIATYGARKLLYQNVVEEKLNKTYEILSIQKSEWFIFGVHSMIPILFSLVASLIAIIESAHPMENIIIVVFIILISPVYTFFITKTVNRPKEISYGNIFLCVGLILLFIGVCSMTGLA